jgi:hypothetical protein
MPSAIDASIKRKVIRQWLAGDSRSKIAIDNNVGEGTVSAIVSEFKIGLDAAEFDSSRELALAAKKQGLNLADLAAHARLYNFIRNSGATENEIELFVTNVSTGVVSPEKVIQNLNQLYEVSQKESIPLDQVPNYIKERLEQKQKIDEDIIEAVYVLNNLRDYNKKGQLQKELSALYLQKYTVEQLCSSQSSDESTWSWDN